MDIDITDYPYLCGEHMWSWGPVKTTFELGEPPLELVSNINIVPFNAQGWIIIRQKLGWGIVGGTLEPDETYLSTLKRELLEEAGCELLSHKIFGALRMTFLTEKPYRPHLPFPISYRILSVGEVRQVAFPSNPVDGEEILEVRTLPLAEASRLLEQRPDDGPLLADIYRFAAMIRNSTWYSNE